MPKLYEYLGLIIFFYANEHEPIHVHGSKEGREAKAELIIIEGQLVEIRISGVKGKRMLEPADLRNFKKLVEAYREEIISKWIDFFVYNRRIVPEFVTKL